MQLLLHLSVVAQNLEKALAVELAVDLAVYGHDRGKAATAETGDGFNREDAVFGRLPVGDSERGREPVLNQDGPFDMAGGSVADTDFVFSGFRAFELGIECENTFYFSLGNGKMFGNCTNGVVLDVAFTRLNELETFDQVSLLTAEFRQIGKFVTHN